MNKITHFHYCQGLEQQPLLHFQIGNTRGVRAPPGGLITNLIIILVIHQPTLMQINWRPGEHTALPIKYCYDLSRYHSIYLHMYVHLQVTNSRKNSEESLRKSDQISKNSICKRDAFLHNIQFILKNTRDQVLSAKLLFPS